MEKSFVVFLILVIFAEPIARLIIGDIQGGNTINDITFVIRVIATALLVIPSLSISRGYLQGNKYIIDTVKPDAEIAARYEERYRQFALVYPTVKELFPKIQ